jgi:hypothetical protein
VSLGLGEGCGDSSGHPFPIFTAHAYGGEYRAVTHRSADADFNIGRIDDQAGDLGQGAVPPLFEGFVELDGVSRETGLEVTSSPHSFFMTLVTRRVEAPWLYLSAMATLIARSTREPLSSIDGRKGSSLSRVWGTRKDSGPTELWRLRSLSPLASPWCPLLRS